MFHSSISVADLTTSNGTVLYCIRMLAFEIDCFNIQKASALPPDKPLPTKVCGTGTFRSCAELSTSTISHCLTLLVTALPKVLPTIDGRNWKLLSTGHLLRKYLPFPSMVPCVFLQKRRLTPSIRSSLTNAALPVLPKFLPCPCHRNSSYFNAYQRRVCRWLCNNWMFRKPPDLIKFQIAF